MAKTPKKKPSNPRIGSAPKKRRTKLEIRRSQAAKKGHQTRRINRLADAKRAQEQIEKKLTESGENRALRAQLESVKEELERTQKALDEKWVKSEEDEWLHRDGTVALHPSRMRHGKMGQVIRKRLIAAEAKGPRELRDLCRAYALELDIPIQEFYTLLMSP